MIEISEKEFYQMRKRAGICPKCGREDAYTMGKRTSCAECAEKARERAERRREDPDKREIIYSRVKALKQARKSAGLCPDCGGVPMGGHVKCVRCVIRDRSYKTKYRGGPIPRGQYGTCWQCNKTQAMEGKRLCPECYSVMMEHTKRANAVRGKKKRLRERGDIP